MPSSELTGLMRRHYSGISPLVTGVLLMFHSRNLLAFLGLICGWVVTPARATEATEATEE